MKPLETRGVTKRFGSLVAVDNVSIAVEEGSITMIIGPNGAGKTTFFNLVSGVLYPDSGRIYLYGVDVTYKPLHARTSMGLGRSFQSISLFPFLTVLESVVLALAFRDFGRIKPGMLVKPFTSYGEYVEEALSLIETIGLKGREHYPISRLNQADQRKLDLALAIASKPRLLLLDEPTAGLALEEIPAVTKLIGRLRDELKLTILMVEHKIDVVRELAEWVIVMNEGRVIAEGTPEEISRNEEVNRVYLGEGAGLG